MLSFRENPAANGVEPNVMKYAFLLTALVMFAFAAPARAQRGVHEHATVGLYLTENPRSCDASPPACSDNVRVTGELSLPYYAYLCVLKGDRAGGVAGIQFAIDYDPAPQSGVDVWSWVKCTDLEFPQSGFPASGLRNVITWDFTRNCQDYEPAAGEGVTAVGGYFYLTAYSNDRLSVIPVGLPNIPDVLVTDCGAAETHIDADQLGHVGFSDDGSVTGNLPCVEITIEDKTWGGIKQSLGHD